MYRHSRGYTYWDKTHTEHQLISKHISVCLITASSPLLANPTGGDVVGGSATIDYGSTTIITQHTDKAIVNWQDFSIDQHETTQFVQPSSSSVILNRVVGGNASQIMGKLQANGTVFLVNPNGIVFGKDAVVDVGGLVASTASISNQHFMEGHYQFTDAPDNSSIINEGRITVAQSGYAALVAPNVENSGVIEATLGQVTLASGKAFTVDLYGDNLITLDATPLVSSNTVKNSGAIIADGGKVTLTAGATDSIVESLINMDGYVQAQSIGMKNGKVVLMGNDNTTIKIAGKIDVSGKKTGEKGGKVQASAHNIKIENASVIDSTGDSGGGTVHIGGEYQGGGTLAHAEYLSMDDNALIDASAINAGDGGEVILWSDLHTIMNGQILSKGGALSGNGGLVETSSKIKLDFANARINTQAFNGQNGTWLIDPTEITVDNTYAATLTSNLALGNVTIQTSSAGNDIEFTNTNAVTFSANTFTVIAHNDIIINSGATVINNSGSGATNLRADSDGTGGGTITFTAGNIVSSGSGAVNFFYNPAAYPTATNYAPNVTASGTFTAYMLVNTATDLQNINSNLAGSYALNNDIDVDASIADFTSIGGEGGAPFTGIFRGSILDTGYGIFDLNISAAGLDDVGLFGSIDGATLTDIGITNATITGASNVGAIVGSVVNSTLTGTMNVSTGTITGTGDRIGGLVGTTQNTNFTGEFSNVNLNVDGVNNVGGIIGYADSSTNLSNTSSFATTADATTVTIQGTGDTVGGLIGYLSDDGLTFEASSLSTIVLNSGVINVTGDIHVGGLIGRLYYVNTMSSSNPGAMSNSANVTGNYTAGGIFGAQYSPSFFTSSSLTNAGNITGINEYVGGIVGNMQGGVLSGNITIGDLTMSTYEISGGSGFVGGVAGYYSGSSSLINLDNITINTNTSFVNLGSVTAIGGVIGYLDSGLGDPSLSGTFSTFDLTDVNGAIIGLMENATDFSSNITNATNISSSRGDIGGVVGRISSSTISGNLSNTASIQGTSVGSPNAGGIAGRIENSTINGNFTHEGDVTAAAGNYTMGGIAGLSSGSQINGQMLVTGGNITNFAGATGGLFGSISTTDFGVGATLSFNAASTSTVSTQSTQFFGVGGLIGRFDTNSATTFNMEVTGDVTVSGDTKVGGLIGLYFNSGNYTTSSNMTNEATVVSTGDYAGGIFGRNINSIDLYTGTISNSGSISGDDYVGGLFGQLQTSSFNTGSLTNTGTVTGTSHVGGMIGRLTGAGTVASSMNNTGEITGGDQTGGLIGLATTGVILSGTGISGGGINTVTAQGNAVGGLFGEINSSTISGSYQFDSGTVRGLTNVGGVIGLITNSSTLDTTAVIGTNTGAIVGDQNIGGLIGNLDGSTTYNATSAFENDANVITSAAIDSIGGIFGVIGNLTIGNDLTNYGTVIGNNATALGGIMGLMSTGSFTGSLTNAGAISGSSASRVGGLFGSVTGGGFSGNNHFRTISGSSVSGSSYVGGLIGELGPNASFTMTGSSNIYTTGSVAGTGDYVGGLFGSVLGGGTGTFTPATTGTLTNNATVSGVNYTAGIFGSYQREGTNAYTLVNSASGDVTSTNGAYVGGIFGRIHGASSAITLSGAMSNAGDISNGTGTNIGGIFGSTLMASTIFMSGDLSNTGNISSTGTANVGGIGGYTGTYMDFRNGTNDSVISNTGNVIALNADYVGGLIGRAAASEYNGTLSNTGGTITGTEFVGGIFGFQDLNANVHGGDMIVTRSGNTTITASAGAGGAIGGWTTGIFTPTSITTSSNITIAGGAYLGGLFGAADGGSNFILPSTYTNTMTVTGSGDNVGGLFGGYYRHTGTNALSQTLGNTGAITGANKVGGIAGDIAGAGSTISGSLSNAGVIIGSDEVGGIFGEFTSGTLTITADLDTTGGSVSGSSNVGGLIGNLQSGTYAITSSISNAATVSGTNNIGGAFGQLFVDASSSPITNTGSVTGDTNVGGIAGSIGAAAALSQAQMTTGTVTGNAQVGGIAGTNAGTLTDVLFGATLATSGVSPTELGGIAGANTGTITNALAIGTYNTSSASSVGALVGNNTGTVNTSYYDTRLFATSIGAGAAGGIGYSTNLEFYTQSSYIGFSFPAIWTLSGTSYYASLTFCSTGCQKLLPTTPAPTPTPTISSNTASGIVTTIANNQTTNMINPISYDLTTLDVENFMDKFGSALDLLGLTDTFLNNVTFFQTYTASDDLTQQEQAVATEQEMIGIIEALSEYYCGS